MTPDEIQKDREVRTLLTGAGRIKLADLADAYLALITENAALKARVATEFNRGYMLACCNLDTLYDQPTIAAEVLMQAGISAAEVKAMSLSDYDAKALRRIRKAGRDDPIGAALEKSHDRS